MQGNPPTIGISRLPPQAWHELPAAGYRNNSDLNNVGSNGNYWSSTQNPSNSNNAYGLAVNLDYAGWFHTGRHFGYIVRPVSRI